MQRRLLIVVGVFLTAAFPAASQQPVLSLEQCEQIALRNHPRIASAGLSAKAAESVVNETRAALYPVAIGNLTTAGADKGTVIGAGALPTSSLSSRIGSGVNISQLVTDFGRTNELISAARLRAASENQFTGAARAEVVIAVDRAYFATLAADAVLSVARATLDTRQVLLRQIRALAASNLKSTLDVSFAEVAVSEAELALYQADNDVKSNHARLSAALGYPDDQAFDLAGAGPLPTLDSDIATYIAAALKDRPDLAASESTEAAARHLADAEKRLRYPAINLIGTAGMLPVHPNNLAGTYAGAGLNIGLPFLNGGLFSARRAEAEYRAGAAGKNVEDLKLRIVMGVRVAWLQANTAFSRMGVSERLVGQASTAFRLAQTRYDIGLSSIVELTQAQFSLTSAQIAAAGAKYEYLIRFAELNYATGVTR